MVKIYKSSNIFMNKSQPVILNIPKISQGLRDLVIGDNNSPQGRTESENLYNRSDLYGTGGSLEGNKMPQPQEADNEILQTEKKETDRLTEENDRKAAELFEQARIDGYNKGIAEVEEMKRSYQLTVTNACRDESKKLEVEYEKKMSELEEQFLDLSLSIAGKVIQFELSRNDEAIRSIVQDALDQIRIKHGITIKASKQVCEAIKTMESVQVENIQIAPQDGWANFACQIESIFGTLDPGWEKKMERISQMLCGELV